MSPFVSTGDSKMKKTLTMACLVSLLTFSGMATAAAAKTYQVTGPILEIKPDVIVVQKGKEKWEITRGSDTKVQGELKVGAKVTIEYRMTAASIEVK
jgi:cytochrome c1